MLEEVLKVVLLGIMLIALIRAVKAVSGGISHALMIFVSLYLAYYILINVFYIRKIPSVKLPRIFSEIDTEVELKRDDLRKYEYREIID